LSIQETLRKDKRERREDKIYINILRRVAVHSVRSRKVNTTNNNVRRGYMS
jgi:hypothetical protein